MCVEQSCQAGNATNDVVSNNNVNIKEMNSIYDTIVRCIILTVLTVIPIVSRKLLAQYLVI